VYKYGVNEDRFFDLELQRRLVLGKKASRFSQPCRHSPEKPLVYRSKLRAFRQHSWELPVGAFGVVLLAAALHIDNPRVFRARGWGSVLYF